MQPDRTAFIAGMTAALFASGMRGGAAAAELTPVRAAGAAVDATGELFYGHDNGMFAASGLDVQVSVMRNSGALTAAQQGGSVDVTLGTIVPTAQAVSRGIGLKFFAPCAIYSGSPLDNVIIVASDSKFTTAADLNGKTFAVSGLRDLSHLTVVAWMDAHGGDWKSIKVIEIPFPEVGAALLAGRVDAAISVEPFLSGLKGKVRILGDSAAPIAKRFLITGWIGTDAWLAANRATAKRFADTTLKVGAWANAHRDDSAAILAKNTPVPIEVLRSMNRATYETAPLTADLIAPVLTALTKYFGVVTPRAADLIWNG